MSKMFYSLEEAADKLGKSVDQVRDMAAKGQLQEFRDRDKLMFKKDQVDILAGGDDDMIQLAGSGELEPLTVASSGSRPSINEKESTGISIFEDDATDTADANAVTGITSSPALIDPSENSGSAGALLDLTREGDDTSLGASLKQDVYGDDQSTGAAGEIGAGEALFESSPNTEVSETATSAAATAVLVAPIEGSWSGIAGGVGIGVVLTSLLAMTVVILSFVSPSGGLVNDLGDKYMILVGASAGLMFISTFAGWFIGRKG